MTNIQLQSPITISVKKKKPTKQGNMSLILDFVQVVGLIFALILTATSHFEFALAFATVSIIGGRYAGYYGREHDFLNGKLIVEKPNK